LTGGEPLSWAGDRIGKPARACDSRLTGVPAVPFADRAAPGRAGRGRPGRRL